MSSRGRLLVEMAIGKENKNDSKMKKIPANFINNSNMNIDKRITQSKNESFNKDYTNTTLLSNENIMKNNAEKSNRNYSATLEYCPEENEKEESNILHDLNINANNCDKSICGRCSSCSYISDSQPESNMSCEIFVEPEITFKTNYDGPEYLLDTTRKSFENVNLDQTNNDIFLKLPSHKTGKKNEIQEHYKSHTSKTNNNASVNIYDFYSDSNDNNDNSRDKDFNIFEYTFDTIKESNDNCTLQEINYDIREAKTSCKTSSQTLSEKIKSQKNQRNKIQCKYCKDNIDIKNFSRHLKSCEIFVLPEITLKTNYDVAPDIYDFHSDSTGYKDGNTDKDFHGPEYLNDTTKKSFENCILEQTNDDFFLKLPSQKTENKDEIREHYKSYTSKTNDNASLNIYDFYSDSNDNNDDSRDKDFNILEYLSDTTRESNDNCTLLEINDDIFEAETSCKTSSQTLSEKIKSQKKQRKKMQCKYCEDDVDSKNYTRHLKRKHPDEKEVDKIFQYPKKSKERKLALGLLRNETNFNLYTKGTVRPNRQLNMPIEDNKYYPCAYCKGLFIKQYLRRHIKCCEAYETYVENKNVTKNHVSRSHTITACAVDPTNVISTLNVKEQVFDLMKGDDIAFEAKKDLLICHFGESYLKRHKRERLSYACSTRMRELARLVINFRKMSNKENLWLKDLIHPNNFDTVISAVRNIAGYDSLKKSFKAPSLAMHLGTSLKTVCDELTHLVLKESNGFKCKSREECKIWLESIKKFKLLIISRWNIELSSLANKDLQEKRWSKPSLLPIVADIKKFREETLKIANNCKKLFENYNDNESTYKDLVQCILSLLIIFNRRRIGDVQYLKIKDYQLDNKTTCADFENVLTECEKMLTKKYKRVVNSGKGSRAVVILIPEIMQEFINLLLKHRSKYISSDNEYLFATPGSKIKWGKGDVAIRTLTRKIKLENPEAISSNKLRKQIATVMQILNLSKDESKQFSDFMGHTQKTHEEFYELPVDIYQTAKVSKLLLMMEKGAIPSEFKGKSLSQINFDKNLEYKNDTHNIGNTISENCILNSDNETIMDKVFSQEKCILETDLADDENDEISMEKNKRCIKRKDWSQKEINLLTDNFKKYIDAGTYPPAINIKSFIKENNVKRNVSTIKSKIQHLINKNKKELLKHN